MARFNCPGYSQSTRSASFSSSGDASCRMAMTPRYLTPAWRAFRHTASGNSPRPAMIPSGASFGNSTEVDMSVGSSSPILRYRFGKIISSADGCKRGDEGYYSLIDSGIRS